MSADAPARLRELLRARGVEWRGPIHHFEAIDSTNRWLKERGLEGAAAWTVALADRQTAGRGRAGREWWSPPGGVYVSALLDLPLRIDAAQAGVLALMAGVAVADALREGGVAALLKWPNDVRIGGRKVAGVLAETVRGRRVVLGIGVNVGGIGAHCPDAAAVATSLHAEGGRESDPLAVCAVVLGRLTLCYDALATVGPAAILARWRSLAEPWWGRRVEFQTGSGSAQGTVVGIDEDGALIVDRGTGGRERLLSGDVTEIRLGGDDAQSHDTA